MKVHNYFGSGFKEHIYERSLDIELRKNGFSTGRQIIKRVFYYEDYVGESRLDILVERKILLEIKAVSEVDDESYNRMVNYLKVFNIEVGLLINFGSKRLEFKRFANSKPGWPGLS